MALCGGGEPPAPPSQPPRESPSSSPLPLLMVPSRDGSGYGRLFSVSEQKLVGEFHDMLKLGMWPCWASLGWVVLTNRAEKLHENLLLANPLTRCHIQLPLPTPRFLFYYIKKVVLTSDPIKDPANSVLVALLEDGQLYYWKPGEPKWSFSLCTVPYVENIVHFKRKFCFISRRENVYPCDAASFGSTPEVEFEVIFEATSPYSCSIDFLINTGRNGGMYLVVSTHEQIIRVERHGRRQRKTGIRTAWVEAFKLHKSTEGSYIWEKMETMEDDLISL